MKKLLVFLAVIICLNAKASSQSYFFLLGVSGGSVTHGATIDSLTEGSVSNAATMDINFSSFTSAYQVIFIEFTAAPASNAVNLECLVSANGSTFDNSSAQYDWWFGTFNTGSNSASSAFIEMVGSEVNTAGTRVTGSFQINDPASTAFHPQILFNCAAVGSQEYSVTGGGRRINAQATQAVRLLFSSGNITGYYKVFGMKN
jgi:hypothetical protein